MWQIHLHQFNVWMFTAIRSPQGNFTAISSLHECSLPSDHLEESSSSSIQRTNFHLNQKAWRNVHRHEYNAWMFTTIRSPRGKFTAISSMHECLLLSDHLEESSPSSIQRTNFHRHEITWKKVYRHEYNAWMLTAIRSPGGKFIAINSMHEYSLTSDHFEESSTQKKRFTTLNLQKLKIHRYSINSLQSQFLLDQQAIHPCAN